MPAKPGRIYQQCDPRVIYPTRIRIDTIHDDHAAITYLDTRRPGIIYGRIRTDQLHDSPTTKTGKPRRTGYALETK
ncbi:hypothetical protein OG455_41600 [Kitasatospora sp. NBC_01287]|uniref:hypothetical protein n=1 Tax=Kitasatospora sp. NBC_01287 TaxID=2903573 RepID=UPI002257F69E|nr:hypothetical protein [Kitasatospora sp. NBC_01287]MCX4750980.1 hypothetical protein [Kitasatospora sp. NBC_01287]MCX4751769.1 hypothetical protein [Kitasatospora sp. NBC_01287]MCX4751939.1 hypothetical protein [Kitasatospora sp. NBC_01287]